MAFVKLYNKTGDEKAVAIQERIEKMYGGQLPQTFQAMGRTGDFLNGMTSLAAAAGKGLDPKVKELIAIAVCATNGCEYCLAAHAKVARSLGISDDEITAAIEVAAAMSAFNKFNAAIGLDIDIK